LISLGVNSQMEAKGINVFLGKPARVADKVPDADHTDIAAEAGAGSRSDPGPCDRGCAGRNAPPPQKTGKPAPGKAASGGRGTQ
jgi:hypothetical protein